MSASSSAKHPSLLHTGAPVCQKTGADLQEGGREPQIRGSQPQGLVLHAAPWWSPPWPRLPAVRLPNPRSSTHPLHLLPVPSPSSRQHPLPLGPAPRRCHPRSGSLPARARRSGPARALVAAPATAVRTLRRPAPPSPSPRPERCRPRSRRARQFGPVSFSGQDSLPVAVTFRPFHRCVLGGPLPPPPRGDMEAIKWRTRK